MRLKTTRQRDSYALNHMRRSLAALYMNLGVTLQGIKDTEYGKALFNRKGFYPLARELDYIFSGLDLELQTAYKTVYPKATLVVKAKGYKPWS